MNLKGIAQYLESKRLGRMGETIFATEMPLECKEGLLLMDTYPGSSIDHELPGWRNTGFRVVMRSADYEQGFSSSEKILKALTIQQETNMGLGTSAMLVKSMLPMHDPLPYRRGAGGYWEFEVDVECVYIKS